MVETLCKTLRLKTPKSATLTADKCPVRRRRDNKQRHSFSGKINQSRCLPPSCTRYTCVVTWSLQCHQSGVSNSPRRYGTEVASTCHWPIGCRFVAATGRLKQFSNSLKWTIVLRQWKQWLTADTRWQIEYNMNEQQTISPSISSLYRYLARSVFGAIVACERLYLTTAEAILLFAASHRRDSAWRVRSGRTVRCTLETTTWVQRDAWIEAALALVDDRSLPCQPMFVLPAALDTGWTPVTARGTARMMAEAGWVKRASGMDC